MAKDLPYFKFFCSEWNDGDVTLEDYKYQGLFINICSYYWSNECDISLEKLYKRFRHNKEDIDYLFKVELIHKIEGFLCIKFLNEQQEERIQTSKKNSNAGKVSAERRRLAKLEQDSNKELTSVEITLNEKSTIKKRKEKKREEKKREDEKREDNIHIGEENDGKRNKERFLNWFNKRRTEYLKKPSHCNTWSRDDETNLKELKRDYTKEQFEKAMESFCKAEFYVKGNFILPEYFLQPKKFVKFLNAYDTNKVKQQIAGDPTTW